MSAENVASNSSLQEVIDQRLDQLDRALLGLLPRSERLAIMAQVELQVRNQGESNPRLLTEAATAPVLTSASERSVTRSKRSRMAIAAGVLGIIAIVLMLFSPVGFILLSLVSDALDETLAMILFVSGVGILTLTGALAVALGITSLVRLARSRSPRLGHGWAITGLCTGPLPMLFGGLGLLMLGSQLTDLTGYTSSQPAVYASSTPVVVNSSPYGSPGVCGPSVECYPATPAMPPPLPSPSGDWQPNTSSPSLSAAPSLPPSETTAVNSLPTAPVDAAPTPTKSEPTSIETTITTAKPSSETAEKSDDSETKSR